MPGSRLQTGCRNACSGMNTAHSEPDMNARGFVTISTHEFDRLKIIETIVEHQLKLSRRSSRSG
jgi:hypothetical protein